MADRLRNEILARECVDAVAGLAPGLGGIRTRPPSPPRDAVSSDSATYKLIGQTSSLANGVAHPSSLPFLRIRQ